MRHCSDYIWLKARMIFSDSTNERTGISALSPFPSEQLTRFVAVAVIRNGAVGNSTIPLAIDADRPQ